MFTEHPRSPHDIPAGHLDDPVASTDEYPTCEGCALVPNTTKQHTVKRIAPFIASQFTNTKMQYSDTKIEMAIKKKKEKVCFRRKNGRRLCSSRPAVDGHCFWD
jgi:hypothetical protein